MEIKFGVGETPVVDVQAEVAPATETANTNGASVPATIQSGGLALGGSSSPTFKDIILPRINIAQNIGELKNTFEPGTLVFARQTVLFVPPDIDTKTGNVRRAATPPAVITVLDFRPTRYAEKVGGGVQGLIVNSEEAVRANGGTLDFQEWKLKETSGMKYFRPLADAVLVVERPESVEDDDTVFVYEVDGKKYALALWGLLGTSYTALAKRVFFTQKTIGCLRGGYPTWSYNITTREETYTGGNKAWIPLGTPRAKSTPAFLEFAKSILQG